MKTLTAKEEEIMGFFWEKGPMFVKQLLVHHCPWIGREGVSVSYGFR